MSKDSRLFVRIDSELKRQYEAELRRKGLTISQHLTDKIKELVVYSQTCWKCDGTGHYPIQKRMPGHPIQAGDMAVVGMMKCEQCQGGGQKQEVVAQ